MPVVGTAYVRVKVLSSGLSKDIADNVKRSFSGAERDLDNAGERAGERLGRGAAKGAENVGPDVERAGTRLGDRFANRLDNSIVGAIKRKIGPKMESAFGDTFRKVFRRTDQDLTNGIDFSKIRKNGSDLARELKDGFNIGLGAARIGPAIISLLALAGPSVLSGAAALGTAMAGELVSALGAIGPGITGAFIAAGAAAATALLNFGLLKLAFKGLGDEGKALTASFKDLGKEVGKPVGQGMLAGMTSAVATLRASVPLLTEALHRTGEAFGEVAKGFADTVTSSENMGRIQGILATNTTFVKNFGVGLNGLTTSFLILFNAAKPFIDSMGESISRFGQWAASILAAKEANGELATFMDRMLGKFLQLWQVIKDVGAGIMSIFRAASPVSEQLMGNIAGIAARFREWTGSEAGQAKMTVFFEKSHELASKLLEILGKMARAAGNAFVNMDTGPILHALDTLANVIGPAVADIFKQIKEGAGENLIKTFDALGQVFQNIAASGNIQAVATIFSTVLAKIAEFATTDIGANVTAIIAPFLLFGGALTSVISPLTSLVGLLAGLSAPVLAIGAAVAAAVGFFILMYQNSQSLRDAIGDLITMVGGKFQEIWTKLAPKLEAAWNAVVKLAGALGNLLAPVIRFLTPIIETMLSVFGDVFGELVDLVTGLVTVVADLLTGDFAGAWEAAKGIVSGFWDFVKDLFGGVVGWLGGIVSNIWNAVSTFTMDKLTALWHWLVGIWDTIIGAVGGKIGEIRDQVVANFTQMVSDVQTAWANIVSFFTGIMSAIGNAIMTGWQWVVDHFTASMEDLRARLEGVWNAILAFLGWVWNGIVTALHFLFDPWIAFFQQLWDTIWGAIQTAWNAVFDWLSTRWNDFVTLLHGIFDPWVGFFQAVWDGIQNVWHTVIDSVYDFINTRWNDFLNLLHGIFDPWPGIFQGIWDGIQNVFHTVVDAITSYVSGKWEEIKNTAANVWNAITGLASTIWNAIINKIKEIVDGVTSYLSGKWDDMKSAISTAWDSIRSATETAWNAIYDAIIEPIQNAINWVTDKISGLVGPIQSAWDTISGIFGNITTGAANAASAAASAITSGIGAGLPGAAEGGYVNPVAGGFPILVAEGGQRERIEPLDANGLSTRDKAMIAHIVAGLTTTKTVEGNTVVQVLLDGRELAGVVQSVVTGRESVLARRLAAGQRRATA